MNCCLLGDQHTRSPYHRILIVILRFGFCLAFEMSSLIRVDFLRMWLVSTRYAEFARPLRVVLVVDVQTFQRQVALHFLENSDPGSCLQQRVSSQLRSSLHLFATLGNLTLRHFDSNLQLQAALALKTQTLLTGCSEYPRTVWCIWTRRCRRPCRSLQNQVQRRLRLCHNSLFSC